MAHDRQYIDCRDLDLKIIAFDYPKPGDRYWSRVQHRVCLAEKEICVKCAIIERAIP